MWFKEVEVRVLEGAISTPATCLSWRLSKWQSIREYHSTKKLKGI